MAFWQRSSLQTVDIRRPFLSASQKIAQRPQGRPYGGPGDTFLRLLHRKWSFRRGQLRRLGRRLGRLRLRRERRLLGSGLGRRLALALLENERVALAGDLAERVHHGAGAGGDE